MVFLFLIPFLFLTSTCGEKSEKTHVEVSVAPNQENIYVRKNPISIPDPLDPSIQKTIEANWALFSISIKNIHSSTITIISIDVDFADINDQKKITSIHVPVGTTNGIEAIPAGETYSTGVIYFYGLPNEGQESTYLVTLKVDGWIGNGLNELGKPISVQPLTLTISTYH